MFHLAGQRLVFSSRFPASEHMIDKVDTLLQTVQLNHGTHIPLLMIDNQFDLLLALLLVQLTQNLRQSHIIL